MRILPECSIGLVLGHQVWQRLPSSVGDVSCSAETHTSGDNIIYSLSLTPPRVMWNTLDIASKGGLRTGYGEA